jgi:outer membrane lipoprotein-sorting protein
MSNEWKSFTREHIWSLPARSLLFFAAVLTLMPVAIRAQTVDEVIAKNIEAHGGIDKLKSVMSIKITQTIKAGGFQTEIRVENKRPDKIREEVSLQGLTEVLAYDGKVGWVVNPFGGRRDPEVMSQDDLKGVQDSADIDGPLVDYAQKGHKAELLGHDSVEGTDCYKVRLTLKNGDVRTYFLDTDSFLEIKIESQTTVRGTVQESELYFGDYEKVDGMYFPFAVEQGPKGGSAASRVNYTISKIEINLPLDDSLFAMPVTPSPQPTPKQPGDVK